MTAPAGPHVCTRAYTGSCRLRRGGHEGIHRGARREEGGRGKANNSCQRLLHTHGAIFTKSHETVSLKLDAVPPFKNVIHLTITEESLKSIVCPIQILGNDTYKDVVTSKMFNALGWEIS